MRTTRAILDRLRKRHPFPTRALFLAILATQVSSCAVFAPQERSTLHTDVQETFSLYPETTLDQENRWWEHFQSPELNRLVEEALANSPTLQQSWARLMQAEAIAARIGAAGYPTVDYEASASNRRNMGTETSVESYLLGLNAAYEVDLWGRIKSETQAAALDRDATREQLNTAAITLASQTTLRWIGIVAQKLQTEVIRKQLASNRTSLELIELRFRKSQSTALDVYQQRQAVAGTESRIPLAELREELLLNELAALLGRGDLQSLEILDRQLPLLGDLPGTGIPVDVLANRPDVRQAGLALQSADWRVSAARADRLPTLRLTAGVNYADSSFADLFDDWFANLAASVTGPVFDGGRRKAEVERTRAVVNERLAAYRETVIQAIKEVEDALISEQKQRDYMVALERNLELSRSSYREAVQRYRNGLSEYLPVLVDLVNLQNLERDHVEAQFNLLRYRIHLNGALGGAWPRELVSPFSNHEEP